MSVDRTAAVTQLAKQARLERRLAELERKIATLGRTPTGPQMTRMSRIETVGSSTISGDLVGATVLPSIRPLGLIVRKPTTTRAEVLYFGYCELKRSVTWPNSLVPSVGGPLYVGTNSVGGTAGLSGTLFTGGVSGSGRSWNRSVGWVLPSTVEAVPHQIWWWGALTPELSTEAFWQETWTGAGAGNAKVPARRAIGNGPPILETITYP